MNVGFFFVEKSEKVSEKVFSTYAFKTFNIAKAYKEALMTFFVLPVLNRFFNRLESKCESC